MKTCPRCKEYLGYYADRCFKCGFKFNGGNNITPQEQMDLEITRRTIPILDEKDEQIAALRRRINDNYEYAVEIITDSDDGGTDFNTLVRTLDKYSRQGWRLVNTFTNELGENAHFDAATNTRYNSTMDQVILIFERRIIKHETYADRVDNGQDPYGEENAIIYNAQQKINAVREQVRAEMAQRGTIVHSSNHKETIYNIISISSRPLTAQEIAEPLSEELNLMGVLNYLQSMVNDGTIAKDGNKYFIPQGSSGSGGGIDLKKY